MTLSYLHRAGATALFLTLLVPAGWGLFGQEPDEPPPLPVPGKLIPPPSELLPQPDEPGSAAPISEGAPPLEAEKTTVVAGIDVQTRGPVHEAYAQPYDATPQVGPVVPREPPGPIPEQPPDQKPEGDNVLWIPGYWAWDADRGNFLWVSGCWRLPPPDRKWVPGYWSQVDGGWQWTTGFWADDTQEEVPYVEEPPAPLDNGPDTSAPDDNSFYVPGCWIPRTSVRFVWRPGYWCPNRPGFVWCPAHYCETPSGYVFADGYWDYPLEERGLPFAPVLFTQTLWDNPDWSYQPSYCVNPSGLLASLFVSPSGCDYCFGDYFTPRCRDLGYHPWFSAGRAHQNPLFGYYNWTHRAERGWFQALTATYRGRFDGTLPRPPRSLVAQGRLFREGGVSQTFRGTRWTGVRNLAISSLQPVRPLGSLHSSNFHLTRLDSAQIRQYRSFGSQFLRAGQSRRSAEASFVSRGSRRSALSLARIPTGPSRNGLRAGPVHAASALRSPMPFASARHITTAPAGRTSPIPREARVGPGPRSISHSRSELSHSLTARQTDRAYAGSRSPRPIPLRSSAGRPVPGVAHSAGLPRAGVNPRHPGVPHSAARPAPVRTPSAPPLGSARASQVRHLTPAARSAPRTAPRPAPAARPAPRPAAPAARHTPRPTPVARPAARPAAPAARHTPRPTPVARPAARPAAPAARHAPRPAPVARPAARPAAPAARHAPRPAPVARPAARPAPAPRQAPAARPAPRPAPAARPASKPAPAPRPAPAAHPTPRSTPSHTPPKKH